MLRHIVIGSFPISYRLVCRAVFSLTVMICIKAGFLPAVSQAQFLSYIDVGASLRYQQFHTEVYREQFLPRPAISLSLHTPFHRGYLQGHLAYVRNEALTDQVPDYENLFAVLYWLGRIPVSKKTSLFTGLGAGAETYFLANILTNDDVETELLLAARIELQHTRNNLVFFADAGIRKVYVYHRMVHWNSGIGLRYRFQITDRIRDVVY